MDEIEAFKSPTFCAWYDQLLEDAYNIQGPYRPLDGSYTWDPIAIGELFCMFLDGLSPLEAAKKACGEYDGPLY